MDNGQFGKFIYKLRKEQGLTQKSLGERLNLTDKAVSKWERGLSFPDISILEELADALEVSVIELIKCEKIEEQNTIPVTEVKQIVEDTVDVSGQEINRKLHFNKIIMLVLMSSFIIMLGIVVVMMYRNTHLNYTDNMTVQHWRAYFPDNSAYDMEIKDNVLVFTNPNDAMRHALFDYCDAIKYIRITYSLNTLSLTNYPKVGLQYLNYSAKMNSNDERVTQQARDLNLFLQVYANTQTDFYLSE